MPRQVASSDAGLFFTGVFSSVLALVLLLFVLVLLPFVLFDATSTVPNSILELSRWVQDYDNLPGFWHRVVLISPLLVLSGLLFLLSWYATVVIEKKDKELARLHQKVIAESQGEEVEEQEELGIADKHPAMLIIALVLVAVGGIFLLESLAGANLF